MSSEQERFLETLSRPWQDNAELHLLATQQLQAALDASGAKPEELVAATETLERADRNARKRKWWMRSFYLVAALVSLFAIGHLGTRYFTFVQIGNEVGWNLMPSIGHMPVPVPEFLAKRLTGGPITRHFGKEDALFLMGDPQARNADGGRWKCLLDRETNNPAYLVRYVAEAGKLPEDFLETSARIDPDNGWFPLHAAVFASYNVQSNPLSGAERKAGKLQEYTIKDMAEFRKSVSLLHVAASKPRCETYSDKLSRRAVALLPGREDLVRDVCRVGIMGRCENLSCLGLQSIGRIVCAEAQRCAKEHDREGFERILADWHWLVRTIPSYPTLVEGLVFRALLGRTVPDLRHCASSLDMPVETNELSVIEKRMQAYKAAWDEHRHHETEQDIMIRSHQDVFGRPLVLNFQVVSSSSIITQADLLPLRRASYSLVAGAASLPSMLLFWLFCGVFAIHRFRHGELTRAISSRLARLLRVSDWLWIAGLGIVFPLGYDLAITRLLPCSVRDQSWDNSWMMKQLSLQQAAALLLMILLSSLVARWRISARGSLVGISRRWDWFGLLCIVLTAAALPVFGMFSFPDLMGKFTIELDEKHDITPVVYLSPALVWLLIGAGRAVFGRSRHALRRVTLARVLVPVWALAALVLALSEPVYYAEECHWVAKDKLFEITPDAYPTRYEHEVAKILRAEYLEILNGPRSTPHDTPLNEHE
jgi:hypothetical protein